jgi:hypothetical protein
MRLNDWTAIIVFVGAVAYLLWSSKRYPGRETTPYLVAEGAPVEDAEEIEDVEDAEAEEIEAEDVEQAEAEDVESLEPVEAAEQAEPVEEASEDASGEADLVGAQTVEAEKLLKDSIPAQDGDPETVSAQTAKANES